MRHAGAARGGEQERERGDLCDGEPGGAIPGATVGLYLRGGVGISTLEVSATGGGLTLSSSESGFGLSAGLGYDVRTGSNFSVSPYGVYQWGDFDGGSANTIQIGLGVQWH